MAGNLPKATWLFALSLANGFGRQAQRGLHPLGEVVDVPEGGEVILQLSRVSAVFDAQSWRAPSTGWRVSDGRRAVCPHVTAPNLPQISDSPPLSQTPGDPEQA